MRSKHLLKAGLFFMCSLAIIGCGLADDGPNDTIGIRQTGAQSLYDKYGAQPGLQKMVDDIVAIVMNDPTLGPYFSQIGQSGHDSLDRFKSCLDLQMISIFGGPATYPGVSHYRSAPVAGYTCEDMTTAHTGMGLSDALFDRFVDLTTLTLTADGVSNDDLTVITPSLNGTRSEVVGH